MFLSIFLHDRDCGNVVVVVLPSATNSVGWIADNNILSCKGRRGSTHHSVRIDWWCVGGAPKCPVGRVVACVGCCVRFKMTKEGTKNERTTTQSESLYV